MPSRGKDAPCTASAVKQTTFLPIGNHNQVFLNTTTQFHTPCLFFCPPVLFLSYISLILYPLYPSCHTYTSIHFLSYRAMSVVLPCCILPVMHSFIGMGCHSITSCVDLSYTIRVTQLGTWEIGGYCPSVLVGGCPNQDIGRPLLFKCLMMGTLSCRGPSLKDCSKHCIVLKPRPVAVQVIGSHS
jgi:hypothetical protein